MVILNFDLLLKVILKYLINKAFYFKMVESSGHLSYYFLPYKSRQNSVCFPFLETELLSEYGHLNNIISLTTFFCLIFKRQTKPKQNRSCREELSWGRRGNRMEKMAHGSGSFWSMVVTPFHQKSCCTSSHLSLGE